jgi:hypothetical protein
MTPSGSTSTTPTCAPPPCPAASSSATTTTPVSCPPCPPPCRVGTLCPEGTAGIMCEAAVSGSPRPSVSVAPAQAVQVRQTAAAVSGQATG